MDNQVGAKFLEIVEDAKKEMREFETCVANEFVATEFVGISEDKLVKTTFKSDKGVTGVEVAESLFTQKLQMSKSIAEATNNAAIAMYEGKVLAGNKILEKEEELIQRLEKLAEENGMVSGLPPMKKGTILN